MKRIVALCLSLALLLACVPTPEEEVVFGDAQIKTADAVQDCGALPETVQKTILDDGQTRVVIDASVTVKAEAPYAEIAYEKAEFTDRELNAFLNVLIGDAPVYKAPERAQNVIKAEMEACVYTMEHTDPSSDDYKAAEEELRDLQEEYRDAPSKALESEPVERRMQDVEGIRCFLAVAQYDGHTVELSGTKNWLNMRDPSRFYEWDGRVFEFLPPSSLDQGQAEATACALAEKLAPQLALCETVCKWNDDGTAEAYHMIFRPAVNGVGARERFVLGRDESISYAVVWHADRLEITVDREGIVQVSWTNPGKASPLPQTDVGLLPFEEILSHAKQQLKNMYVWTPEDTVIQGSREIYVDRIVLEYAVVMWRDHGDVYKLIPVWNFYGGERAFDPELGTIEQYGFRTDVAHISIDAVTGKVLPN